MAEWELDLDEEVKKLLHKETTKVLELGIFVVYTPLDDALGTKVRVKPLEAACELAARWVSDAIRERVSLGSTCTVAVGSREAPEFLEVESPEKRKS